MKFPRAAGGADNDPRVAEGGRDKSHPSVIPWRARGHSFGPRGARRASGDYENAAQPTRLFARSAGLHFFYAGGTGARTPRQEGAARRTARVQYGTFFPLIFFSRLLIWRLAEKSLQVSFYRYRRGVKSGFYYFFFFFFIRNHSSIDRFLNQFSLQSD